MSDQWAPIRYRDFYDFPRAFVVERSGDLLFFDCPFIDALDDYGAEFTVFKVRDEYRGKIEEPSWTDLKSYSDRVGVVPIKAVKFDKTKRRAIDTAVFTLLDQQS